MRSDSEGKSTVEDSIVSEKVILSKPLSISRVKFRIEGGVESEVNADRAVN